MIIIQKRNKEWKIRTQIYNVQINQISIEKNEGKKGKSKKKKEWKEVVNKKKKRLEKR